MILHLVLKIGKYGICIIKIKKLHLLYLLFVSLCFHNFYRLSYVYVLIPITIYLLLFLNIDRKKLKISNSNKLFISYLLILFMSLYIVAISFVSEGFIYTIIGITRYFYVLIIALVVFIIVNNEKTVNNLLHLYVICIAIGSLTLPLQLFTGPISWFSDPTMRSGLIRYSSLFGNVSAMGIIGGTGLVSTLLLNYKNKNIKRFISLSILIGMGMSLQRAGIANIILAIIVYVYLIDIKSSSVEELSILPISTEQIITIKQYLEVQDIESIYDLLYINGIDIEDIHMIRSLIKIPYNDGTADDNNIFEKDINPYREYERSIGIKRTIPATLVSPYPKKFNMNDITHDQLSFIPNFSPIDVVAVLKQQKICLSIKKI